jgi:predicted small lipoprotein YifL
MRLFLIMFTVLVVAACGKKAPLKTPPAPGDTPPPQEQPENP